jgi:dephospho-CoA kinase
MITVGLTGGIGSGKSSVARIWEKMGARVLYADNLAKELMVKNPDVRQSIVEKFGIESYHPDGSLNREYLSIQAFNSGRVRELNSIVHPAVYEKTAELIEMARSDGTQMFVKEAALLLINGRPENLDVIVVVTAPADVRIKRVSKRDSIPEAGVKNRIETQQTDEELINHSDYVIRNNKDLSHLEDSARKLFFKLSGKNASNQKSPPK